MIEHIIMSERENHDGNRNSTPSASETKAPHSSYYAPYPRLSTNNITPPLYAPISGAASTTMLPEFKPLRSSLPCAQQSVILHSYTGSVEMVMIKRV